MQSQNHDDSRRETQIFTDFFYLNYSSQIQDIGIH